jgi:hypothetical protein
MIQKKITNLDLVKEILSRLQKSMIVVGGKENVMERPGCSLGTLLN